MGNKPVPAYRDIERYRSPPFFRVRRVEYRKIANLDNEIRNIPLFLSALKGDNYHPPPARVVDGDSVPTVDGELSEPFQTVSLPPVPLPEEFTQNEHVEPSQVLLNIRNHLTWIETHATELASSSAGLRQLQYLEKKLENYRNNITKQMQLRKQQRTFSNNDTVYFP